MVSSITERLLTNPLRKLPTRVHSLLPVACRSSDTKHFSPPYLHHHATLISWITPLVLSILEKFVGVFEQKLLLSCGFMFLRDKMFCLFWRSSSQCGRTGFGTPLQRHKSCDLGRKQSARELDSQTTNVFGRTGTFCDFIPSMHVLLYLLLCCLLLGMGIPLDCYGHFASEETKRSVVRYPIPWLRDLLYQHLWVVEDICSWRG